MALVDQGAFSLPKLVDKLSHKVAECFRIRERGYIREGYFADLVLIDPNNPWTVSKDNLYYKCGWSPFEGVTFKSKVLKTFVNGRCVYDEGKFDESVKGQRLTFEAVR